jgi:hypothetical protein
VRDEYIAKYEKLPNDPDTTATKVPNTKDNNGFTSFGDLSVTTAPRASEIQEYLNFPVKNVKDPLKWWVDNKYVYLNLYHMALDYLSIPGKCYVLVSLQ